MPEKDKSFRAVYRDGWLIPLNPADVADLGLVEGQKVLLDITRDTDNAEAEPSEVISIESDSSDEVAE